MVETPKPMTAGVKRQQALLAFVLVAAYMVALCVVYEPRFETNDDVAMSMIAHGYGDAAYSSPTLIYSNVVWGYVVRAIPTVRGVLGYSTATMTALLVAGWALLYFLFRLGVGCLSGVLVVSLTLARPIIFPQFTINAGLLTLAAVVGWQLYARHPGRGTLVVSCLLGFSGYLIRTPEFFLVLAVASPLLPWRALRERREAQVAFMLLAGAIGLAAVTDRLSYRGPEWQRYGETRRALTAVATWGYGKELKLHPEVLSGHGYSKTDIDLIENAFWADPQISDPGSLNAMVAELPHSRAQGKSIEKGIADLKILAHPALLPLVLPAIVLLVFMPRWAPVGAWSLWLSAVVALAALGRPGITRIYLPLASLLIITPLVSGVEYSRGRRWLSTLTLCGAWIGTAYVLVPQATESAQQVRQFQRDIRGVPAGTIVNWANSVHHEFVFPVLASDPGPRAIRLHDVSAFAFAPFSVATSERKAGRGVIERLRSPEGIAMFTPYGYMWEWLQIYCGERWKGTLTGEFIYRSPSLYVQQVRCLARK